jgi:cob(I)alamin adenosyltransferase
VPDRIYTRTGDTGETGLFGGGRVAKDDVRVEAYGAVDELNAVIGAALVRVSDARILERLRVVQADLFTLGAHLATPNAEGRAASHLPPLPEARVAEMERWIDECDEELPPLRAFILPGGRGGGAALHHARTVCRRAERRVVTLAAAQEVDAGVVVYLNRLSDVLFTFARLATLRAGDTDVKWEPERG